MLPSSGSVEGGKLVEIIGNGFGLRAEATLFRFGTAEAITESCAATSRCVVLSPPHLAGSVTVRATVNGQTVLAKANAVLKLKQTA